MLTETISGNTVLTPTRIMQTGFAFWSSKVLLSAVNFKLFTLLAHGSKTAEEIRTALDLQQRGLPDFLDALVALNFLYRHGNGSEAKYCNTLESDTYLDKNKATYVGGILEMANNRLFPVWSHLEEALQTGRPQNEGKNGAKPIFETMYSDEKRLEEFIAAMGGIQIGNFIEFARQFNFSGHYTHCDVGGAGANLSIQIALHNPAIQSISWDLPKVEAIAARNIQLNKLGDRVVARSGDFFTDEFPRADVITMGNILHDWDLEQKKLLIQKAYNALPAGGALVVIENVIDDERRENAFGLLMSLNMLVETYGGFDYTAADFTSWAKETGFTQVDIMHLTGPASALIAYK
ncbi:methyltransferase [Niastella vici]|uniref:Methyltransferase n=1 Tax=Niastella vici TaxID=1703345 RepID=A0A1V9G164_9BACT|nr:methyltransferase [Niastella vici]OQP64248.1 methyltransferase [Niastella vici]